ncbi:MAG TPA: hypothetical protein VI341_02610 [Actinomycetota bacterium]
MAGHRNVIGLSIAVLLLIGLLATPASAAPNPGARRIIYVRSGDIYSVQANGLNARRLTWTRNNAQPEWAPGSNKIVFISTRDGDQEIFTMNPDGSGSKQLTHNRKTDNGPTWSPDGRTIAFERDFDFDRYGSGTPDSTGWALWLMNPNGTNQRKVPLAGPVLGNFFEIIRELVWSPSGDYIAGTGIEWTQTQDFADYVFPASGGLWVTANFQGGLGVGFASDGDVLGCGYDGLWKWSPTELQTDGELLVPTIDSDDPGESEDYCHAPTMSGGLKFVAYLAEHYQANSTLRGKELASGIDIALAEATGPDPYDWAPSGRLMVVATPAGIRVVAPDKSFTRLLPVKGTDPNW